MGDHQNHVLKGKTSWFVPLYSSIDTFNIHTIMAQLLHTYAHMLF
jgi:hypothetical protein